ncbi:aminopeptidase P family protein [Undibacterium sp. 5I1]|uniref:aminopeptidase P family protein n=1 Tax=unclassified Undibacterium TaxID=2630295 RepID=UPI002AB57A7A|nr:MULTISPECIES: aminopeptidase P family protein [unclassified Undibacterium]MDY7537017.1 aminopeptidase P family protein [Undibacterium sp. 5I1]MEB0231302.1 aminopeptidase P family protein [Undibacterium sp. 10I3]MEB0258715.1 aminopeptidase P family protein [Undibacterium sp. 5I1]
MNSPLSPAAVTSPIPARLVQLRAAMKTAGLDAYIIPSADPHLSEYLPQRWQGREQYSGFTGSVGTLIVTADFAGLWVDSRYWSQAEQELAPTGIQMMKINSAAATLHLDWLASTMQAGQTVGVDGAVLGLAMARMLEQALQVRGSKLDTSKDLLQTIWSGRPDLPQAAIYEHLAPFAVVSRQDKLALVREQMRIKAADWHFVSTVDDLAWIFNLRGADVSYNPVFVGHALISQDSAALFVSHGKVPAALVEVLAKDGVFIADYAQAASALAALPANSSLLIDPRRITYSFRQAVPASVKVIEAINPSVFAKSRKTPQEAQFVREAMEQDGAALCEFFSWLEASLGKEVITELTIDEKITAARARQPNFVSASFGTIAGFNGNGAMPHYRALPESHAVIEGNGLLLIDSGGQYLNGTTDITRVMPIGVVSAEQKRDFTLVLKGMINLSRAQFPRSTLSPMLDALARAPIWAEGINYGHGTGHGVGYFLNVHEGPQSISGAIPEAHNAMEAGMITSNEPGIYRPGKWGVRIENLMLNIVGHQGEFGDYLKFETLTLCPIDTRCIDMTIIREDELAWLNDYHATVLERLSQRVSGAAKAWLEERTKAVSK